MLHIPRALDTKIQHDSEYSKPGACGLTEFEAHAGFSGSTVVGEYPKSLFGRPYFADRRAWGVSSGLYGALSFVFKARDVLVLGKE